MTWNIEDELIYQRIIKHFDSYSVDTPELKFKKININAKEYVLSASLKINDNVFLRIKLSLTCSCANIVVNNVINKPRILFKSDPLLYMDLEHGEYLLINLSLQNKIIELVVPELYKKVEEIVDSVPAEEKEVILRELKDTKQFLREKCQSIKDESNFEFIKSLIDEDCKSKIILDSL